MKVVMVAYHPDSRFLTDFASANLPLSEAICVSVHLEYCGKCRAHVKQLSEVGAVLMESAEREPLAGESFDQVMASIDAAKAEHKVSVECHLEEGIDDAPNAQGARLASLVSPRALKSLLSVGFEKLNWVQLGAQLRIAPLVVDSGSRETAIYDIKAGGKLPDHEHRGEEITVLLKGSFSDAEGSYTLGDFIVRNKGEVHQPTVTQDMGCVCLVSLERPIKPRSWFYRLLEPYVQYRLSRATAY
jgi:putative transcriptional regulator